MNKIIPKILILLIVLSLALYFYSQGQEEKDLTDKNEDTKKEEIDEKEIITFEKTPAKENANYFQDVEIIEGQPMYYSYPLEIEKENPPALIVYSHGQLQRIVDDLDNGYMQKVQKYGEFFSEKGFAFSASNQHDDNWGQAEALRDIQNSIEWFEKNDLPIAEKTHMIGFSMGGRAAINYTVKNPEMVKTVSLLAPTPRENLTQEDVEKIEDIDIKIWHGTNDVNIPFSTSQQYVQSFENFGKGIKLISIEGAEHYDIETSLMDDILEFIEK